MKRASVFLGLMVLAGCSIDYEQKAVVRVRGVQVTATKVVVTGVDTEHDCTLRVRPKYKAGE